ncbi:MAG: TolC family protein [Verrucomicrobiota bacterium]
MRAITTFSLVLSLLAASAVAQPAEKSTRQLSLADCFELALQHNFDVQISRFGPERSGYDLEGAYGAYDPTFRVPFTHSFSSSPGRVDPITSLRSPSSENFTENYRPQFTGRTPIGLSYTVEGGMRRSSGTSFTSFQYNADASVSVTQPLLKNGWIDSDRLNIAVGKNALRVSELDFTQQVMDTVLAVELAYYELIYSQDNVKVQEKALELAERLLAENKKRVEVGALAPLDEKQAESQVAARKADLLSAQRELASRQNALKNLLTDDYQSWRPTDIAPTDTLLAVPSALDVQESWNRGINARPEIQKLKLALERQNITLRYNKNQLYPQLDLSLSYGHNGLGTSLDGALGGIQDGNNVPYSVGFVFSIPLNNTAARNRYKATKVDIQRALLELKKQEQSIVVEIDDAVKLARTNFERVDATRQARLYAEAALEAEEKKLANGKSTSFVVLQLQRDLTAARSSELRALADYNRALAQLSRNEGVILEKNQVNIEVK